MALHPATSLTALALALALALPAQAQAQGQTAGRVPDESAEEQRDDRSVDDNAEADIASGDIVIIGRFQNSLVNRLPIDPINLPFSLDLIDDNVIRDRGFLNQFDALQTVPNLVQSTGAENLPVPTFRARGFDAAVLTNNRPEAFSRGVGQRDQSFIERIEVLRGPASILLGPVLPGGVINQVTKSPEEDAFLDVRGRLGSFDFFRGEADANLGSLFGTGAVRGRITAAYETQGSAQRETEANSFAIRPVVEIDLSERTRVQAAFSYARQTGTPASLFPVNTDGTVPEQITPSTFFGVPSRYRGEDIYLDGEFQHEFSDNLRLVLRGSYQDTTFADFRSSGGDNSTGDESGFEPGDPLVTVVNSRSTFDDRVIYGDAQLVGHFQAFGQRQDWVIGATYQKSKSNYEFGFGGEIGVVDINNPGVTTFDPQSFDYPLDPFALTDNRLHSVYAETNFRPIDRLTVVAGARYDKVNSTSSFPLFGIEAIDIPEDDVTVRVGASYAFTDAINGYISYAESFLPQSDTQRDGSIIGPETATNYEAGVKARALDERLHVNAAIFSLTRQNVSTPDPTNDADLGEFFFVATGEQRHRGVEISAQVRPIDGLTIDAAYGYVDIEVTRSNSTEPGRRVGDPGASTNSKHNYSIFATYEASRGPLRGLSLGGGVRGISDRIAAEAGLVYPGYNVVDAFAAYRFANGPELRLNVLNLTDSRYRQDLGFGQGSVSSGHLFASPRAVYLSVEYRF